MHKEEVQELLPEGASHRFSHKLRPCKPHRFNIRYSSRATILSASFPLFCFVCFHFLRVAVNARRPALFSNRSSPLFLSLSLSQLDPSLEAKVNVQKQSAILEEEYEVRSDGL